MIDKKKNATIHDIAKQLKIAASTVSRALNDHPKISDETKNKVKAVALKLGYGQNISSNLRKELIGKTVAILLPNLNQSKYCNLAESARKQFEKQGYKTMICASSDSAIKEDELITLIQNLGIEGILLSLSSESKQAKHLEKYISSLPIVQFDIVNFDLDCSRITIDYFQAGYKAAQHLLNAGCKKVAHIGGLHNCPSTKQISMGYKTAARNSSAVFGGKLEIFSTNLLNDIPQAIEILFSQKTKPDSIIIDDILAGHKLSTALKTLKIDVPNDVAIIAIGDENDYKYTNASTTSILLPYQEMGVEAAKSLIKILESKETITPETIILPFKTKISNSTLRNSTIKVKI